MTDEEWNERFEEAVKRLQSPEDDGLNKFLNATFTICLMFVGALVLTLAGIALWALFTQGSPALVGTLGAIALVSVPIYKFIYNKVKNAE